MANSDAISGFEFWQQTEFGKALAQILPPGLQRVIIDIPVEGLVKIYYQSVDTNTVLNLDWGNIIQQFEVVHGSKEEKTGDAGDPDVQDL